MTTLLINLSKTQFTNCDNIICVDETSNNQNPQQEQPAGTEAPKANEIPKEYSNIRPQETVSGWRQGPQASEIPSDARIPANAQQPTIFEDD